MSYNLASKLIHWLAALVILGLLICGLIMSEMDDGATKFQLIGIHKAFGVIALLLLVIRIPVRATNPVLPLPGSKPLEITIAKLVKRLLYLLMLIMPISGIAMSQSGGHDIMVFGWQFPTFFDESESLNGLASTVHAIASKIMIALLTLHIAAALYHHCVVKDETLKRMSLRN